MKDLIKKFGIIILALFLFASAAGYANFSKEKPEQIGLTQVAEQINNEQIEKIAVVGDELRITLKTAEGEEEGVKQIAKKERGQSFTEIMSDLEVPAEQIAKLDVKIEDETGVAFWAGALLPYLFPVLLLFGLIYYMSRQVQGANNKAMSFGKNTGKEVKPDDKNKKTFKDVAGAHEAKEELEEIVDFLKDPKKFDAMGAKIPKGVLLMGPPGTGKTLIAKAVAGEANVPFFHISGSEFVEMFVGVGASRVRSLFEKAKKSAPSIIFIDEIDAVGRKRGAGLGGGHDEREQTLNQILVEMDGFEPNLGVIIIAATNRPDVLDQALLRPGRFDRQVVISGPDMAAREEILKVHGKNKPFADDVDLKNLAQRTPGFTGADLESLLNEAAILAVRKEAKAITEAMVRSSIDKVLMGPEKKSRIMTEEDKKMTAYHEAGHAIVGHFLKNCDPVRKVSIIGRGMAGGYTLSMPDSDQHYQRIAQFKDQLAMIMGGYSAEQMIYGDENLTTGPSSDLKKATQMATKMIKQYGMSPDLGPRVYGSNEEMIFLAQEIHDKKNYSEKTAEKIDAEINRLLVEAKNRADETLTAHKADMERLVKALMEHETVEQEMFNKIMKGE
ncbi:MAG: ATP-dependent zinc metalloprotease FtsH [Candidatus Magasanikbacteria bacterium]|jgi:cell division protease FtsH|nr:ATP-dependent zinc metalloprotease FtsH [Candidatus Magasanikbacteria bacterium]